MQNLKNLSKRALALTLSLVLCLSLMNLTVFAADEELAPGAAATETLENTGAANTPAGAQTETPAASVDAANDQTEVSAPETVSEAVTAFLNAAVALPETETVTAENAAEVLAQTEACQTAYDRLSQEEMAREDVAAAKAALTALAERAQALKDAGTEDGVVEVATFEELAAAVAAAGTTPTTITVTASFPVNNQLSIPIGADITLRGASEDITLSRASGYAKFFLVARGSLTLESISIDGNHVANSNPLVYVFAGGSCTLETGAVLKNNAGKQFGAVQNLGDFTMNGGAITGSSAASYGGGVYSTGTFTINGGAISGNSAVKSGGGLYGTGTLTLNGGEITGNTAVYGGGLYAPTGANAVLSGVSISGNTANYGAGAYVYGGKLTMTGGEIAGNTAINDGGGLYASGDAARLTVSGDVRITDNKSDFRNNNVCLGKDARPIAVVGGLGENAVIGLLMLDIDEGKTFVTGMTGDDQSKFVPDLGVPADMELVNIGGYLDLRAIQTELEHPDGEDAAQYVSPAGEKKTGSVRELIAWANRNGGGAITLLRDVDLSSSPVINSNVTLDLSGHTLDLGGNQIWVGSWAGIEDKFLYTEGSLTLEDSVGTGVITGGKAKYSSEERDHTGGAVYVYYGIFTMNGGAITGNTATIGRSTSFGGAVFVANSHASFVMNGGVISGNDATYGGGVFVDNGGTFTMNGGAISGNKASNGGGIFIQTGAKGYIYAGRISGNQAHCNFQKDDQLYPYGGGGIYVNGGKNAKNGKLYLYNAAITGNTAEGQKEVYQAGAGLSSCPTSNTYVYLSSGGAIYGNGSNVSQVFVDGRNTTHHVYLSKYMLGGGAYNWTDAQGNALAEAGQWTTLSEGQKVNAYNTVAAIPDGLAKVVISGNTSAQSGGGIGSNGDVYIGSDLGVLTLSKKVVNETGSAVENEFTFTITLTNADGSAYVKTVRVNGAAQTPNEKGELTVTLGADETAVLSNLDVGVRYAITEGANKASDTAVTVNGHAADKAEGVVTKESEGVAEVVFTNTYKPNDPPTVPVITYTSLSVNKVWAGDDGEDRPASVSVQLYRDGEAYGAPVTLDESNGWSHTWSGLDESYTWTVGELNVPEGYTASVSQSGTSVTITNTYEPEEPSESPEPSDTPEPSESPEPSENPEEPEPSEKPEPPEETEPDEEIDESEPPLAELPEEPEESEEPKEPELPEEPDEEIDEPDVPKSDVPQTGDDLALWMGAAAMSGLGLAALGLKRREGDEA